MFLFQATNLGASYCDGGGVLCTRRVADHCNGGCNGGGVLCSRAPNLISPCPHGRLFECLTCGYSVDWHPGTSPRCPGGLLLCGECAPSLTHLIGSCHPTIAETPVTPRRRPTRQCSSRTSTSPGTTLVMTPGLCRMKWKTVLSMIASNTPKIPQSE